MYCNVNESKEESPAGRANEGLFLSFQKPNEVPGITRGNLIRKALEQRKGIRMRLWDFRRELKKAMDVLQMDESYAERDLNVGFSGGEKKRLSIAAALSGRADILILDEPGAALDLEAKEQILTYIRSYVKAGGTVLLTSHEMGEIGACTTLYVLKDGVLVPTEAGLSARELIQRF